MFFRTTFCVLGDISPQCPIIMKYVKTADVSMVQVVSSLVLTTFPRKEKLLKTKYNSVKQLRQLSAHVFELRFEVEL